MSIRSGHGRCCRFALFLRSEPLRGAEACASIVRTEAVGAAFMLPSFKRKGNSAHDFTPPQSPMTSLAQGVLMDQLPEHRGLHVCRQFLGHQRGFVSQNAVGSRVIFGQRQIEPGRNALPSQSMSPRGRYELDCPCHALTNGG